MMDEHLDILATCLNNIHSITRCRQKLLKKKKKAEDTPQPWLTYLYPQELVSQVCLPPYLHDSLTLLLGL